MVLNLRRFNRFLVVLVIGLSCVLGSGSALAQAAPPAGPSVGYVWAWALNVRSGPGLGYGVVGAAWRGDRLPLIGRNAEGTWLQVQVSSPYPTFAPPTGWVSARYIWSTIPVFQLPVTDGSSPPVGEVTAWRLNVRGGPGLEYSVVNGLTRGMRVTLLGRNHASDWLKVAWGGYPGPGRSTYTGWVKAYYVKCYVPIYSLPVVKDSPSIQRIRFAPGGISATLEGRLPPNGIDRYVLTARAGQTMTVTVSPTAGHPLLSINGANGEVLKSSGVGSASWSGVLPLTQDYFLTIIAEGDSAVNYTLQVTIPPV